MTELTNTLSAGREVGEAVADNICETMPVPRSGDLVATGRFDYTAYPAAIAKELLQAVAHIRAQHGAAKSALADIGAELIRVKEKVGHGNWGAWLDAEFALSISTAERYMNLARAFGDQFVTVSILQETTLYRLAAKSTPTAVRDAVIADLEAGTPLSDDEIRQRVSIARAEARRDAQEAKLTPKQKKARERRQKIEDDREAARRQQQEAERQAADAAADKLAKLLVTDLRDRLPDLIDLFKIASIRRLQRNLQQASAECAAVGSVAPAIVATEATAIDPAPDDEPMPPFMSPAELSAAVV